MTKQIDLTPRPHKHFPLRTELSAVLGTGKRDADIPDLERIVLAKLDGPAGNIRFSYDQQRASAGFCAGSIFPFRASRPTGDMLLSRVFAAPNFGGFVEEPYSEQYRTLVRTADVVQRTIVERQFDLAVDQAFGAMLANADWAVTNMPIRFEQPFKDHRRQIVRLSANTRKILPLVRDKLIRQNPHVPGELIISHAIEMVFSQLPELLYVLKCYDAVIDQYRSGDQARLLHCLNSYMTAMFHLFEGGDLHEFVDGGDSISTRRSKTQAYQVGDLILTGMVQPALFTIPKGPIGLHLLNVPKDMLGYALAPGGPMLGHEGWHNFENDRVGMLEERLSTLAFYLKAAYDSNVFTLSSKTMPLGGQTIETIDFVIKVMTDWLQEMAADASGMISFNGPRSSMHSINPSFWAINTPVGRIEDNRAPYSLDSVYSLVDLGDGNIGLELEPHPEEYWRLERLHPVAYRELGFHNEADEQSGLIRRVMGAAVGDTLRWRAESADSDMVIEIPRSDLDTVAEHTVRLLLRRPLQSLGGKSCLQFVNWDPHREHKKRQLVEQLLAGSSDVPVGVGDILPTFWIPAATDACHELARRGVLTQENLAAIQELAMQGIERTSPPELSAASARAVKRGARTP